MQVRVRPNMQLHIGKPFFLRSVVVHRGSSPDSGHYVCYVKKDNAEGWWLYDDEECTLVEDLYPDEIVQNGRFFIYSVEEVEA